MLACAKIEIKAAERSFELLQQVEEEDGDQLVNLLDLLYFSSSSRSGVGSIEFFEKVRCM